MRYLVHIAVATVSCLIPVSSIAQDYNADRMDDRVRTLEQSLRTLERQVYRSSDGSSTRRPISASIGDEEEAYNGSNVEIRLSQIEQKLQALTGQLEEAGYNVNALSSKVDGISNMMEARLRRLEEELGTLPAGEAPSNTSGLENSSTTSATVTASPVPLTSSHNAATATIAADGTKQLGTVRPTQEIQAAQKAGVQADYDQAFGLLRQSKYSEATEAFNNFVQKYPKHDLTSNAYYWLGETHFAQKQYGEASVAFLQGYQANTKGSKAPDNLLKLAMSLGSLGKKQEACATLKKLTKEFPTPLKTIQKRTEEEKKKLGC